MDKGLNLIYVDVQEMDDLGREIPVRLKGAEKQKERN